MKHWVVRRLALPSPYLAIHTAMRKGQIYSFYLSLSLSFSLSLSSYLSQASGNSLLSSSAYFFSSFSWKVWKSESFALYTKTGFPWTRDSAWYTQLFMRRNYYNLNFTISSSIRPISLNPCHPTRPVALKPCHPASLRSVLLFLHSECQWT